MTLGSDFLYAPQAIDLILRAGEYVSSKRLAEPPDAPTPDPPEDDQ